MTTGIVMSVTDELVEQLSALTCGDEGGAVLIHVDQMRALLAERAELKRDAARYWKLRYGSGWPAVFSDSCSPEPLRMVELDAAIDAAMQS